MQSQCTKTCRTCGAVFKVKPSHYDKRFNCSERCMKEEYKQRLRGTANPNYRPNKDTKCRWCGTVFHADIATRQYCSRQCYFDERVATSTQRRRKPNTTPHVGLCHLRPCQRCSERFVPSASKVRKYCATCLPLVLSERNKQAAAKRPLAPQEERFCVCCGTAFTVYPYYTNKTCGDPSCRSWYISERQRGEKSHFWQGGKTAEGILRRTNKHYKQWRTAVFERDDYTCALCGDRGGKLAAHHIKRVKDFPEYIYELWNGITLCWPCHRGIHWREAEYEAKFLQHTLRH